MATGCGLELPTYQDLSKEQDAVLNLRLDGRHLVIGPPGSGKTVMAIYRAAQLYKQHGEKTVLLMYGRLLANYTAAAVKAAGIEARATNIHQWFPSWYRGLYSENPPTVPHDRYQFDWAAIFNRIGTRLPERSQVHIIVDEGQDMPNAFYTVLDLIASGITVMADENQRIVPGQQSEIKHIKRILHIDQVHPLTLNYRNTAPIAAVAARFHRGVQTGIGALPPAVRRGDRPQLVCDPRAGDLATRLITWESSHQKECIGVFLPKAGFQKYLYEALKGRTKNPVQLYSSHRNVQESRNPVDFTKPGLKILAYPSSKGLEFDTVFIPRLEENWIPADDDRFAPTFYVMTSRARQNLVFHYAGAEVPHTVGALPLDLVDVASHCGPGSSSAARPST